MRISTQLAGEGKSITIGLVDPDASVKLFMLERFEIVDFAGPPSNAGVYIVCVRRPLKRAGKYGPEEVMYIGSSQNIKRRVYMKDHPLQVLRQKYEWPTAVYARTLVCSDYVKKEIQMIKLFRPPMNQQHNG